VNESMTTVGEIVAADFRTAAVFEAFGIDFCCGGQQPFDVACRTASADPDLVLRALEAMRTRGRGDERVSEWPVDRLIDHIVTVHHEYVRLALPTIGRYLNKLEDVHGTRHPELAEVRTHFERLGHELEHHLQKEEQVLFPYIRALANACGLVSCPFGTVANPIRMMEHEHRDAGDEMRTIRDLTRGYATPPDGCTTYAVCMAELARFERDLHRHVHLENNVLFPKAIALEMAGLGGA
jgi:regulator of cell morphogenesis and NO signaling